jgi:hypothetical protein
MAAIADEPPSLTAVGRISAAGAATAPSAGSGPNRAGSLTGDAVCLMQGVIADARNRSPILDAYQLGAAGAGNVYDRRVGTQARARGATGR